MPNLTDVCGLIFLYYNTQYWKSSHKNVSLWHEHSPCGWDAVISPKRAGLKQKQVWLLYMMHLYMFIIYLY